MVEYRKRDHYYNMRNNIDTQPLAAVRAGQLELARFRPVFGYEDKFKHLDDEEEEYIDVIGEYPSSEPEPELLHSKAQSLLEQPPSKIYYDNIEKESSDGGFFDRDDLEDEDERNELVIDCKLLNGDISEKNAAAAAKKKTEARICESQSQKFLFPPATAASQEPEVVFNFTLVDTQLVYNESKILPSPNRPVISVSIPAPPQPAPAPVPSMVPRPTVSMLKQHLQQGQQQQQLQQQQRISSQLRNLKELRLRPYSKLMPNDPRRTSRSYRAAVTSATVPQPLAPIKVGGLPPAGPSSERIGSRLRTSAFAPPMKSHFAGQSVHLPATTSTSTNNTTIGSSRRPLGPPYPQTVVERLPKKSHYRQSVETYSIHQHPRGYGKYAPPTAQKAHFHEERRDAPPERCKPRTVTYLPVQFGFGSSVLHNLYDEQKPLDFSKDSPLCQYEAMLKCPKDQQLRQGYHILNSMPIPLPPKPPLRAVRPKVVPMKRHPTLCHVLKRPPPPPLPRITVPPPPTANTTTTAVIDLVSPTPPTPPEPRVETFRSAMQSQIDLFFTKRQKEICAALRSFSDERMDHDQLFKRLEHLEIRYTRDYLGLAEIMIKRYGCRPRTTIQMDYQWPERPQDFVEYFGKLHRQDDLQPRASEATLDIYRMVVGGLLEQFRASMEYFLSRNLVPPTTTTTARK